MQDQAPSAPVYDLGHYLRPFQRQWRWFTGFVAGGFVLGLAYTALAAPIYNAAARVEVGPTLTAGQSASVNATGSRTPNSPVNMDTEAQNVKSLPVAQSAQKTLKTATSPAALLARVEVTVPPNTTVLRIACDARSAGVAQACANAFATAYLKNRGAGETADINGQITSLDTKLAAARAKRKKDTTAGVDAPPHTVAKNDAFQDVATDTNTINTLTDDVTSLSNELPADPGTLESAAGPGVASRARRAIPPITGLILGLLAGVAVVFGRQHLDRYVRNSDDLARVGVHLVAEIEPTPGRVDTAGRRRDSSARTRFDQRVASVAAGSFDADGGVIYVAAVSPGQVDADVAGRLAATLASVGHHVEIVRPRSVHYVAPVDYEEAPHTAPHDPAPAPFPTVETPAIEAAATSLGWPSTDPTGQPSTALVVPSQPPGMLTPVETPHDSIPLGIRLQLELARRRVQFVIIDGDPAVVDAQAYVLAGLSDAAILVVDPEATTRHDLAEAVDQLSIAGTALLGAVIWRPERPKRGERASGAGSRGATRRHGLDQPASNVSPVGRSRSNRAAMPATDANGSPPSPSHPVDAAR